MLTEGKILEHANLLLEKRTLSPAEYHGWVSGATWAMREKFYTYLVFAANGKFYCSLQMQSDKDFEKWNWETKKKGLETVSIRVYTDNPQTTYGRIKDICLK